MSQQKLSEGALEFLDDNMHSAVEYAIDYAQDANELKELLEQIAEIQRFHDLPNKLSSHEIEERVFDRQDRDED